MSLLIVGIMHLMRLVKQCGQRNCFIYEREEAHGDKRDLILSPNWHIYIYVLAAVMQERSIFI